MYAPVSAITFSAPGGATPAVNNVPAADPVHESALSRLQQRSERPVEMTRDLCASLFASMQLALMQSKYIEETILAEEKTCKTYMDHISREMQERTDLTRMSSQFRENFYEAHQAIVHAVSAKYIQKGDALVEVGAGVLDQNNQSYLASLLPTKLHEGITYTDVNPHFKRDAERKGISSYKHAGLHNLSERLGENAYDHILSCCVFDTLSVSDTEKGCLEAFKVLKPGGKLLIISDLMPFQNTLFSHCSDENTILFPLIGPDLVCSGVQMLDKEFLKAWLASDQSKHVPAEAKSFLQQLSMQSPLAREVFAVNVKNAKNGYVFSQYMRSIFGDALKVVRHKEFFAEKMRAALQKAGFAVCEFGLREILTHAETPSRGDGFPNYFINSHGDAIAFKSYVLRPNIKMMQSKVHVIVAKKGE